MRFISRSYENRSNLQSVLVCLLVARCFSIYTLRALGDLGNLIGSLTRTFEEYSSRVNNVSARCFFPSFFRERSFKSRPNATASRDSSRIRLQEFEGFKTAFFLLL